MSDGKIEYLSPVPIEAYHRLDQFSCGKPALDDWLRRRALHNEGRASRTYVVSVAIDPERVVAFYTLATGSVLRTEVARKLRHDLPNPVPVLVLGRLAVDRGHARHGLAGGMMREALARTVAVSRTAGLRALIVHAIDDDAIAFYTQYGFQKFPMGTRTLFLPIETIAAAL